MKLYLSFSLCFPYSIYISVSSIQYSCSQQASREDHAIDFAVSSPPQFKPHTWWLTWIGPLPGVRSARSRTCPPPPGHLYHVMDEGFFVYPGGDSSLRLVRTSGAPWVLPFPRDASSRHSRQEECSFQRSFCLKGFMEPMPISVTLIRWLLRLAQSVDYGGIYLQDEKLLF